MSAHPGEEKTRSHWLAIIACSIVVVVLIAVFVLQNTRRGTIHFLRAGHTRTGMGVARRGVRVWVARRLVAAFSPALTLGISVGGGPGREVFARNSLTAAEAGATDVTSFRKELDMALSDQLTKLAARAKEAEDHAAAAKSKARAQLERDVKTARESAKAQADQLRKTAEANKGQISDWWDGVQKSWNDFIARARQNIDEKRAEHDENVANRAADNAEDDAAFAIDYAYGAIEEAEYAVLDATLARMDADALAAG